MPSTSSSTPAEASRPRRGRLVVAAALVVAVVAGITVWAVASDSSPRRTPTAQVTPPSSTPAAVTTPGAPTGGALAPGFTLRTLDGRSVSLAALRGHPVLVNFWASWCNPCRKEFPLLASALQRHQRQGLEIVGVTYQDIASDSRSFARREHARWILARDDDGSVAAAYGVRAIPQSFFIRRDGTIASRLFGITSAATLEGDLRPILAS